MLPRYRPDAVSLHVNEVRKLLPGRKLAHLTCPTCGRRCQMVFAHPESPAEWTCKVCQRFTVMRNGRYALGELARARNAARQFIREKLGERAAQQRAQEKAQQAAAQEAPPPAPRRRPRTAASVG
jgi:transposase-like protein